MDQQTNDLRRMVATLLMLSSEQLSAETSLLSLNNSLGSAKLQLGLKRLGLELHSHSHPATFGQLETELTGKSLAPVVHSAPVFSQATPAGLQVGLDLQDVRSLPEASDYWEHEFYQGVFAKSEIAYALVQAEPRTHLAGFWCAKEALRKCDPSFSGVGMTLTFVAHDATGRPYLSCQAPDGLVRLPHALSISHTGDLATAVVVSASFSMVQPAEEPPPRVP